MTLSPPYAPPQWTKTVSLHLSLGQHETYLNIVGAEAIIQAVITLLGIGTV
jgi:hypothetical protein